jgi:hypothetical protein
VGHAEKAYDGALTTARRTLVYLRPSLLVVYDALASGTPRTWEWNLHALKRMAPASAKSVRIANDDAQMCVEMLASPDVAFTQTDQFTAAPQKSSMNASEPNQWHGTFATTAKSDGAEFVALLRIGSDCGVKGADAASAARIAGGWAVKAGGRTIELVEDTVAVR